MDDDVSTKVEEALATVHTAEWAKVLSNVVRLTRDIDQSEDAVQDAFASALTVWRRDGIPHNPGAWLTTTSRNRVLDDLRRSQVLNRKLPLLIVEREGNTDATNTSTRVRDDFGDERIRLIFTCCHPALALEARVALTLRLVCGLPTADSARLFLVSEATMAARITRARAKISGAGIPYQVPAPGELPERLPAVLATIFLVFTESHTAVQGDVLGRPELARLAHDLIGVLLDLMPDEPEVVGLAALVRLAEARGAARLDRDGAIVLLEDQDRGVWDRQAITEGIALVERALRGRHWALGPYAIQAAIAALHTEVTSFDATDWPQILALYDVLLAVQPSPVIAIGRAIALGMTAGPGAGLRELDALVNLPVLARYAMLPAARADQLRRAGRLDEARDAYQAAVRQADDAVIIAFLKRRIMEIDRETSGAAQEALHGEA